MTPEQKQHAIALVKAWDKTAYGMHADAMAALLQELVDAPAPEPFGYFKAEPFGWTDCAETDDGAIALFAAPPAPKPVARVTGYYAGYLSIATVDGRVLPTGTALYTAPPVPSVPDMPLSMEQFGGLVGLARDDASEKAIVYKATNIYGETCYFGVKSTAQAWAKSGRVDEVRLRELRVVAAPPAPSVPDWQGWAMRLIDFIEGAEVSSGVCCCGDDMARHASPINCGHSPVDMWDNCVKNLRAEFDKFVATAPTPAEAPADVARDAEPWKLLLENLVEGLNKTHWSSWQGTAHFDEYLQEAISAIERDKLKGQS